MTHDTTHGMTSVQPADWRDDFLACYPALLERLRQVKQVKKVLEAQDLAAISGERRIKPLDGSVYVILDGFTPLQDNDRGSEHQIELGFSIILTMTQYTPRPRTDSVGALLTAIAKSLQGFRPVDQDGWELTLTPFVQQPALPIRYEDGFAYFPLRFTTSVAVIA